MAKGGRRQGAGRKRGIPNKVTQSVRERILAMGPSPLEVLAEMYLAPFPERNEDESHLVYLKRIETWAQDRRFGADKAAPFLHPKLSSTEITGADGGDIKHRHKVEIEFVEPKR